MQTIQITTSQNIDIEYAVAGLGERILALLLDYAIFGALSIALIYGTMFYILLTHNNRVMENGFPVPFVVGICLWLVMYVFYDLLTEIFLNGQSFGKKIMKIKVISLDGARPRVGQYLLRWLFRIVDIGMTGGSVAVISIALSDHKQRLGDMVAGTTLISLAPQNNLNDLVFGPPPADYEPVFNQVSQLTDNDVVLIHDVIRNFNRTRNSVLVYKLAMKLKSYLKISYGQEINEYQFLEIVLNDYNTLTAKSEV